MSTIRRLYIYLFAFAGLAMVAVAAANLGQLLLDLLLHSADNMSREYIRGALSMWGAAALVGLPVWLVHWQWFGQRAAVHPVERASTLRRLYVYGVLAVSMIALATSAHDVIVHLLNLNWADAPRPVPVLVIAAAVWLGHIRIASRDRQSVGESGGSATLRRWYIYGATFVGLLEALSAAQSLILTLWEVAIGEIPAGDAMPSWAISGLLVGAALWLLHWRGLRGFAPPDQDTRATLRGVYLFLALAVAVGGTLGGASQVLYYALARVLDLMVHSGAGDNLLEIAAGPISLVLVYGAAWFYQRQIIRREAVGTVRYVGVARTYAYLVSLLALPILAIGAAGTLWNLTSLALGLGPDGIVAGWPYDLALYLTMVVVGLPVWLAHWGPRVGRAEEAGSRARRIYTYVTLIFTTLALLGSAALLLDRLLNLALGATPDVGLLHDLAHAFGVVTVAVALAFYHWRVLRRDGASSRLERSGAWISA